MTIPAEIIFLILSALLSLTTTVVPREQGSKAAPVTTPVSNGALPIVAPNGSRIAFVSERNGTPDLFVIGADGRNELQLTHTPEHESPIGWTGDGKQILFSVFANDRSTLYAIDPDGRNQHQIGSYSGRSVVPSPDGKQVLFATGSWTATRLTVAAIDGSNAKEITDGSSIAWNVHWSPDGQRLAFTGREAPESELAIFVVNADGSDRRQLSHVDLKEGGAQWPVWSPSGKELAVQVNSRVLKNSAYIWIVDAATGEARKLGVHDKPWLDETPSWFPGGQRIAFQSDRSGRMEIWTMNADGSGLTQITR
jgi:TolB protein